MISDRCGTVLLATALINLAPSLMMPPCSKLEPTMNLLWVFPDLFAFWPAALAIDAISQSWNDFGGQAIVYIPDTTDSTGTRILTELPASLRRTPFGILVRAGFGFSNPVTQAILFFNHYSFDLGYFVTPDVAVVAHDERLTTVTAERSLGAARMNRTRRREVVDKVAAAVMLQSWLDKCGSESLR